MGGRPKEGGFRLIVGLGNPGREYTRTRHNIGFAVVDELARRWQVTSWKKKDSARQAVLSEHRVVLVQPLAYMNRSGVPVRLISAWYRTPPDGILVICDDLDIPFGTLRMRPHGGHGGNNGLRSIIATIGEDFPRIRIGIGRPQFDSVDHVLSEFTSDERPLLEAIINAAAEGAQRWLDEGLEASMQFVNTRLIT
ncbi:MAG: aminoacyl-tRNA hydrolase [Candidatus Eremiobacteraeota bacterium]|nr:aminoacyl-tRNA hydrolase [Candidatus Eremiobacteraeota bacterium]